MANCYCESGKGIPWFLWFVLLSEGSLAQVNGNGEHAWDGRHETMRVPRNSTLINLRCIVESNEMRVHLFYKRTELKVDNGNGTITFNSATGYNITLKEPLPPRGLRFECRIFDSLIIILDPKVNFRTIHVLAEAETNIKPSVYTVSDSEPVSDDHSTPLRRLSCSDSKSPLKILFNRQHPSSSNSDCHLGLFRASKGIKNNGYYSCVRSISNSNNSMSSVQSTYSDLEVLHNWVVNRTSGSERRERNKTSADDTGIGSMIPTIVGTFVFVLLAVIISFGIKLAVDRKKIQNLTLEIRNLTKDEVEEFLNGKFAGGLASPGPNSGLGTIHELPFNNAFELPKERLQIDRYRVLGSGEFGFVLHGVLKGPPGSDTLDIEVAVKTVKSNVDVSYFKAFLSEIKIMTNLGTHLNIISILGTVTGNIVNREVFVALEMCAKGDLLQYLRKNKNSFQNLWAKKSHVTELQARFLANNKSTLNSRDSASNRKSVFTFTSRNKSNYLMSTVDLIAWSRQISSGMSYLGLQKVIHGDLAARNILLTFDNIAKISDFGLSRQLANYSIYQKKSKTPIPWKYLAPESLCEMEFSVYSDIWSYGVTLWELFTLGKIPYPGASWDHKFINSLVAGQRMEAPDYGNQEIYSVMMGCWEKEPTERTSFELISSRLDEIQTNLQGSSNFTPTHDCVYAQV